QAKDPIEVAQAQSRAANARSALAQAESNAAVALANLRAAIGWVDPSRSPAVDPSWPTPSDSEPPDLGALVATGRQFRPEIVALPAKAQASTEAVAAAQAQLKLAEARYTQGLGSQIELADAQTAVTTANGNLISAEWQLADAWAALRRALGES